MATAARAATRWSCQVGDYGVPRVKMQPLSLTFDPKIHLKYVDCDMNMSLFMFIDKKTIRYKGKT